ncbi:MAG: stage II sporulation protein M [Senegalia sp. (in: firmicutes)]|uniref:stage II sporulation protein M n=1 Tax=Senegalia sp. (in: firmicutes) TaxID=1924098 RepID=UPI003F9582FF
MFNLKNEFIKHVKNNIFIYLALTIIIMIGISAGVITIKIMSQAQRSEISNFLSDFFKIIDKQKIQNTALLKNSILNNFKTGIVIWAMGIIVIGVPVTFTLILFRGFTIGFSIGFIISNFGFKGFLLSFLALTPQNIFIIPGFIILASLSTSHSINVIKSRKNLKRESILKQIIPFSFFSLLTLVCFVIGGLIEAYITPYLIKFII